MFKFTAYIPVAHCLYIPEAHYLLYIVEAHCLYP